MDQLIDALAQREEGAGDEHADDRDQRPEVGFPSIPERMLIVGRTAAPALSHNRNRSLAASASECAASAAIAMTP